MTNEELLLAEKDFYENHSKMLLFNSLNGAIMTAEENLREDAGVFIELYFGKERKYAWLREGQPSPKGELAERDDFIFGKRSAEAKKQLHHCKVDRLPADGVRIFQLWDRCNMHSEADWDVKVSVVYPTGDAGLLADRLVAVFRYFFLVSPYLYVPVTQ